MGRFGCANIRVLKRRSIKLNVCPDSTAYAYGFPEQKKKGAETRSLILCARLLAMLLFAGEDKAKRSGSKNRDGGDEGSVVIGFLGFG